MLTPDIFAQVNPHCPHARVSRIVSALTTAAELSTLSTPARWAAFLAQAALESGEFRHWTEMWGPTEQQQRYEPPGLLANRLGNTQPGDGLRYRGRGPFMLTGRANYRACGDRLGFPLEADPDLVGEIAIGCASAVDFWDSRRLSDLADRETAESFVALTRRINGGLTALDRRFAYYAKARAAFGLPALVDIALPATARGQEPGPEGKVG